MYKDYAGKPTREKKNSAKLKEGEIMDYCTKSVVTIPPTSTIMSAVKSMMKYNFRRMPIADPGTKRLEGIITVTDIINFFGGGQKYQIVQNRYDGNLMAAVNEEVEAIMEGDVISIDFTSSLEDAIELMLKKRVGGCPVVDRDNIILGIITEKDVLSYLSENGEIDGFVRNYMTKGVITASPDTTVEEAMKLMISRKMRRLPVIRDGIFVGLVTAREILRYFGSGEAFKMLITGDIKEALNQPLSHILSNENLRVYKEPLLVPPDERISDLVKLMKGSGYGVALVVNNGNLEGIITERDLIRFLYSKM
ncbi:CBS domain protein [Archaeoglobus sulfaticallidus PM70-1]|uniref:CBS domain protein n=1 Tax=Archaeoglobus sulfaticallidus PM70-1 TaxID=387631 RepID=N0BNB7_9EURY|nr:CBS domain-containing protein [Archaeoglobus sulfaticallidus]AGK62131.1 CBS domain protein [Archaeoglobus sulfaticallidus PM70-1]